MKIILKKLVVFLVAVWSISISMLLANAYAAVQGGVSPEQALAIPDGSSVSGQPAPGYTLSEKSYFTDNFGNVLMYINVWGAFGKTGRFAVPQDTDITTMLSIVGGPNEKAKLTKMIVYRHDPDEFGKQLYVINLNKMLKDGDTTDFIELRPNDTIIMPGKSDFNFISALGTVSSLSSLIYLLSH
jgi:hypothetical protein